MRQYGKFKAAEERNIVGFSNQTGGGISNNQTSTETYQDLYVIADYVTLSNTTLSGTQTVDGSSPSDNDVILVANQSTASENGLYSYDSSTAWDRISGLQPSYLIVIKSGSTKADTLWIVKTDSFIEGTDNITIEEHSINRNDGSINGLSAITLTSSDVFLGEDASNSYSKGKFTLDDVKTYLENEYDSSYLLRSANDLNSFSSISLTSSDVMIGEDASDSFNKGKFTVNDLETYFDSSFLKRDAADFDSFTGLGSIAPTDVVLVEDASDSFNKKKTTVADIAGLSTDGYWDTIYELSSDVSRTGTTAVSTFSGSTTALTTGKYEMEVTLIGYADSGSPQAYPEFGLYYDSTLSGDLDSLLKFSDGSLYTVGNYAFDQLTNLANTYQQYKGIFEVTGAGDLSMTVRQTVASAATCYAIAGTGYKLRKIV